MLFLLRSLDLGGTQRQLVTLAKELHVRGVPLSVAVFYSSGTLEADLRRAGVRVISLRKQGRWDIAGFIYRWVKVLRQERPVVIQSYFPTANMLSLLAKVVALGTRLSWGIRSSDMDMMRYERLLRWTHRAEALLSRFADLVIVNSEAGRREALSRGFPRARLVVIPNGIDTARFRPDPAAREALRARLGISDEDAVIGWVGRFDPMKDCTAFLRAARVALDRGMKAHFVLVGTGLDETNDALGAFIRELGVSSAVHLLGPCMEVERLMAGMDVLTLSSVSEGFPNVLAEAMACGVPCVSTDVGDAARIVGELGAVVSRSDPAAMASAWQTVLARRVEEGPRFAEALRARIVAEFSLKALANRTESAYAELAVS